ncbi:MAG TPA: dihydropteroate synthase [Candidatus Aquicultor sp.]|jgi:dihydropteroate synthase
MVPRILCIGTGEEARAALTRLHSSAPGIDIMAPKAVHRVIYASGIDPRAANIIKQEMLSRGGEAATPWEALKMEACTVDVILMGTLRQYDELCNKLERQPFGLKALAKQVRLTLVNYEMKPPVLHAGRFTLDLSAKTHVMGILNITPDSFSDGGKFFDFGHALEQARRMVEDGADIIDIGGESTRPGADPVALDEEIRRTIPLIQQLVQEINIPISIDTYKAEVAEAALNAGAVIINDINGLRDEKMLALAAERNVPAIIMHMQGTPRDMQQNPTYGDVAAEIIDWLGNRAEKAIEAGLAPENVLVDPGLGFGKTVEHNLEILRRLSEFKSLGHPIVLGTSRKAFIGTILDAQPDERAEGTLATVVYGVDRGANIVRVHDVKQAARACAVVDAIKRETARDA